MVETAATSDSLSPKVEALGFSALSAFCASGLKFLKVQPGASLPWLMMDASFALEVNPIEKRILFRV